MITALILRTDEGWSETPYYCTEQFPTIGYGFKIGEKHAPLPNIKMTREEGEKRLESHIESAEKTLSMHINTRHVFNHLNDVRKAVLISLFYQSGFTGLLKFRKMWIALEAQEYELAATECLDSLAAKQAPKRFARNAYMLRTGELHAYYG
jgi:lysozyme